MHIKFINTGKGSALSAKKYLLQEHDSKGEIRESVQVLRGNPNQVTAVAESLEFKHTYRSAVIAWHKDDQPTPTQIQEVLNDFERVAFAGLDSNQYTYYAVWHGESNGAGHIHIITPRVELQTGKSMNIAPPGWSSTYDLIVDKYNTKYEWASPKEKHRQHLAVSDKLKIHADTSQIKAKKMLDKAVIDRIDAGLIKDHSDVKSYLTQFGEITRTGKDYISVKPNGFKRAIRLKGIAYGREFNAERLSKEVGAEQRERSQTSSEDRGREVKRIESAITRTIEQRAKYNRGRYDYKTLRLQREIDQSQINDRHAGKRINAGDQKSEDKDHGRDRESQQQTNKNQVKAVDHSDSDRDLNRGRVSDRIMESWNTRNEPTQRDRGSQKNNSRTGATDSKDKQASKQVCRQDVEQRSRRAAEAESLSSRWAMGRSIRVKELHDRIRERIASNCQTARRDIHARDEEDIERLRKEFKINRQGIQLADERCTSSNREAEHDTREVSRSKSRHKDQHQRRASDTLGNAVNGLGKAIGSLERTRQVARGAVKRFIDKVIKNIREITQAYRRGMGMKM